MSVETNDSESGPGLKPIELIRPQLPEITDERRWRIDKTRRILGIYGLTPVCPGLEFYQQQHSKDMFIWNMEIDDHRLRGRGIGALLLLRATQCNLENINPDLETVSRGTATPALVGTFQKVFGNDNVSYRKPREDAVNKDVVLDIKAVIDRERITSIDFSEKLRELADTGHVDISK